MRVPRPDPPGNWVSIDISQGGALVKRVLHVLATESGAPPLPDTRTPLVERASLPVESMWKVYFLVNTWVQGPHAHPQRGSISIVFLRHEGRRTREPPFERIGYRCIRHLHVGRKPTVDMISSLFCVQDPSARPLQLFSDLKPAHQIRGRVKYYQLYLCRLACEGVIFPSCRC